MSKAALSVLAASVLFVPASPLAAQPGRVASALPDGPAKPVVEAVCSACHGVNRIFGSAGYDQEGWRHLFGSMVSLSEPQAELVSAYLARHFPANADLRPTLVEGPATVTFTEWVAPTLGQRVRDPIEAADGSIWWTGMWASLVGHLDPRTGEMREYPLPPGTRPHGIAEDPRGRIWFTGNGNGTVGRLDPETGETTVWETAARDPHTPFFHPNGKLYFTAQGARMVGRLDPTTGALTEVPTPGANPYGLQMDADQRLWIAFNGEGGIASLDPETMEMRSYPLPDPESRVRRLAIADDGTVWFVNSALGRIGHLDPESGAVKEWPSPSGPDSHPYAIAVVDGVVWYNESGKRPDTLVRFDPATEAFQSFPIPSGVGIIRNMFVTEEGNLLIHQSSTNRVGLVKIQPPRISLR